MSAKKSTDTLVDTEDIISEVAEDKHTEDTAKEVPPMISRRQVRIKSNVYAYADGRLIPSSIKYSVLYADSSYNLYTSEMSSKPIGKVTSDKVYTV